MEQPKPPSPPATLDLRDASDVESGQSRSKAASLARERDLDPDSQTPTISLDHFASHSEGLLVLKKFLASNGRYGFPGTDGTMNSNYIAYTYNTHPLVSIFTAHEEHPFDRSERVQYLICMTCITFMFASIFASTDEGINPYTKSLTVALFTIPLDAFVRALLVCGWVQGWKIQRTCEDIGHCCMRGVLCVAFLFLLVGVFTAAASETANFGDIMYVYGLGQIQSWVIKFITSYTMFLLFFNRAKASFRKKYPGLTSIEVDGLPKISETAASGVVAGLTLIAMQEKKDKVLTLTKNIFRGKGANVKQGEEGTKVGTVGGLLSIN